jgi:hypothetical protein
MPIGIYDVRIYVTTPAAVKEATYNTSNEFEITESRTPNLKYVIPRTA